MSSKAQQIEDKVIALLTTPAMSGIGSGGVDDDPDYPETISAMPFVSVFLGDEQPPDRQVIGTASRQVVMTVRVSAVKGGVTGKSASASCDPLMVLIHNRIMSDLTLGGLSYDIEEQGTRRQREKLEKPVAYTEKDYLVRYRTTETSLES